MENVSRDNLIDQLHFMLGEVKRRPKEAYFAVPEFWIAEIDQDWMKQMEKSITARALKLKRQEEERQKKLLKKQKKDNI